MSDTASGSAIPGGVSENDLQLLASFGERIPFQAEEEILSANQQNSFLFIVEQGLLHVRRRSPGGRRMLLGRIEPGQFFGEISLFDPGPTSAAVIGVRDGTVVRVDREALASFARQHPEASSRLLLGMMAEMARRLRNTTEKVGDAIVWGGLLR